MIEIISKKVEILVLRMSAVGFLRENVEVEHLYIKNIYGMVGVKDRSSIMLRHGAHLMGVREEIFSLCLLKRKSCNIGTKIKVLREF